MSEADDIVIAAARAATPPKSQLDILSLRVHELETRLASVMEQSVRMLGMIENIHSSQVAIVEEIPKRFAEMVQILQKVQVPSAAP